MSDNRSDDWKERICDQHVDTRVSSGEVKPEDDYMITMHGWRRSNGGKVWYCKHCAVWTLEDWARTKRFLS